MAARGSTKVLPAFLSQLGQAGHNLGSDTLKVLFTSNSYDSLTTEDDTADFTEVAITGGGYTAGGVTLGSRTFTGTTTMVLDGADVVLAKNASGFTDAKTAVLVNSTHTGSLDAILAVELTADNGTTAVSLVDGEVRITWGANILSYTTV